MMKSLNNQKGTTLVEVLVAFTVLLIILMVFYQAVIASGNLLKKADQIESGIEKDDESFYENKENAQKINDEGVTLKDSSGKQITIQGSLYKHEDSGRYYWKAGDREE